MANDDNAEEKATGTVHYDGTEGGWGSLRGIAETAWRERPTPGALDTLRRQNKPKGFMCVSCAWTKPAEPHVAEFCENGAKATLWELTTRRCTPEFFARHAVTELKTWQDHDLEQQGRLTHPMRFDHASDRYVPCSWDDAFGAHRSIAMYGMGLTQQVNGFENLAALTNLWLLKGNIGRYGTGISPVRGHSNVQGISEKPELVPLDRLAELYEFQPPREEGLNTVKAFIGLGGNFVRSIPEREAMEAAWTGQFHDFNARVFTPGGFYRGNPARERVWKTASGKAQFTVPKTLRAVGFDDAPGRYRLMTLRSNDQFNTTIYGYSDRLRGIEGTRDVLLMHPEDIAAAGLEIGQVVALESDAGDGVDRRVGGLTVTPFLLPLGCIAGYYPELNPLIPVRYHDEESRTPAAKGVPVRIVV